MSTTHLIAFNGDFVDRIAADPERFVECLLRDIRRSGTNTSLDELGLFGARHVASSMNGLAGAINEARRGR